MAKIKQNYLMDKKQLKYLEYLKRTVGVPYSVTVRRLIDKAAKEDKNYERYLRGSE